MNITARLCLTVPVGKKDAAFCVDLHKWGNAAPENRLFLTRVVNDAAFGKCWEDTEIASHILLNGALSVALFHKFT